MLSSAITPESSSNHDQYALLLAALQPATMNETPETKNEEAKETYLLQAVENLQAAQIGNLSTEQLARFKALFILKMHELFVQRNAWFRTYNNAIGTLVNTKTRKTYNDIKSFKKSQNFPTDLLVGAFDDLNKYLQNLIDLERNILFDFDHILPDKNSLQTLINSIKTDIQTKQTFPDMPQLISSFMYLSIYKSSTQLQKGMMEKYNLRSSKIIDRNDEILSIGEKCNLTKTELENFARLRAQYLKIYTNMKLQLDAITNTLDLLIPNVPAAEFLNCYDTAFRNLEQDYILDSLIWTFLPSLEDKSVEERLNKSFETREIFAANAVYAAAGIDVIITLDQIKRLAQEKAADVRANAILEKLFNLIKTPAPQVTVSIVPDDKPLPALTSSQKPLERKEDKTPSPAKQHKETKTERKESTERKEEINATRPAPETYPVISYQALFAGLSTDYSLEKKKPDKALAIRRFNTALAEAETIDEIAKLYTQAEPYINRHNNPRTDRAFSLQNTKSWKKAMTAARQKADSMFGHLIVSQPRLCSELYDKYRNHNLFAAHKSNSFFVGLTRTNTQKKLDRYKIAIDNILRRPQR